MFSHLISILTELQALAGHFATQNKDNVSQPPLQVSVHVAKSWLMGYEWK